MPTLKIITDGLEIEVEAGESLQDICDRHGTSILFGCFSARCGICRIRVVENKSGLSEMTEMERELIEMLSLPPDERLACQCKVVGDVTLEVAPQR
jgi:ferredoxin